MARPALNLLPFFLFLVLGVQSALADNFTLEEGESLPRSQVSEAFHADIEKTLSSDDFARKKTVTRWRIKDLEDLKEEQDGSFPEWIIDLVEFFEGSSSFFSGLAKVLEVLLWLLFIGVILFVLFRYREQIENFVTGLRQSEPEAELPTTMFGLDVQKTSLPKDVVALAKEHWLAGEARQGIAVLLRASLIRLLHEHDCRFLDSDTEAECCQKIDHQTSAPLSKYMRTLVGAWQQIAYAHRQPSTPDFENLCDHWRQVF